MLNLKNMHILYGFCPKQRLWVQVRTASAVLTSTHNLCCGAKINKNVKVNQWTCYPNVHCHYNKNNKREIDVSRCSVLYKKKILFLDKGQEAENLKKEYNKTGVCLGIPNFLIFALKHRLWVLVRIAEVVLTSTLNL